MLIPSRRCAAPIVNSAAALAGWKSGCTPKVRAWSRLHWKRWKPYGSRPKHMNSTVPQVERITIRKCASIDEFQACVTLQKEVWNFADVDLVPLRMFVVSHKIGGQIIGAFDGDTLAGFVFSVPGTRAGHSYLHSHMLAVREPFRNSGLGRRLKLAQRDDALAQGFELLEWTFDPLEIKNAYL